MLITTLIIITEKVNFCYIIICILHMILIIDHYYIS